MASPSLLPAYLIVGANQPKRETAVSRLKRHLDSSFAVFNLDERTTSSDMSPNDIAISLNTLPVGTGFRLVLIHDAGHLPKPVSETIISYLENPNPGCVLCLEAEALAKNTRLYKAVKKVGSKAIVDCSAITGRRLPPYLVKRAAGRGIVIDQRAASELISRVGEDMMLLDRQIMTLAELCSEKGRINVEDVEAFVERTAEVKPWEFLDKVAAGYAVRALELYRHMQNPSHLALLALLTRRIRELVCARSLIDRGRSNSIASELGKQAWQVESTVRSARRFTQEQLAACLVACANCERKIKGGADAETEFLRLVLYICNPA